ELLETKFGRPDDRSPALTFHSATGEITLHGIIDRVDVERNSAGKPVAATIVDYKLGSTPITIDDAKAGANLQLPIYALAVEKVIMPAVRVRSAVYLSVNSAKSIGSINLEKEPCLLEETKAKITQMVECITAGVFPVKPYSSKACSGCPHASLCRIADL